MDYNDTYAGEFSYHNITRSQISNEDYVLWAWRGDYLNLGSGAEIGIYTNVHRIGDFEHWEVDENCALPMKLYLYNYYSLMRIDNIFCWEPNEPQWWITGFNPDFDNPNVNDMISIGVIDLSGNVEMYNAIKSNVVMNKKYFVFDDSDNLIWFIWGKF